MKDFHNLQINTCLAELKSSVNGLSEHEAEKRLGKYGLNELPKQKSLSRTIIFFSQFNNSLIYILLFTGVLSLFIGAFNEAYVIFGAAIINAIVGFFQENKANQAISKLKQLVEHKALVLRGGSDKLINSNKVTVGDIIIIKAGNRIPADGRLIESVNLQIDEAGLTGESLPSGKSTPKVPRGAALADRENMVYAGTLAVSGLGRAVITNIGCDTELGKIAQMVKETKEEKTPLQIRLIEFSRTLGMIFLGVCVLIIIAGLIQGRTFYEMLITAVAVGVASIPEGLILSVTFILALGMQQILKKKALTRKLIAAETLGSTTVICTDKTGTLTEGLMHVAHIVIGEKEFEVKSLGSRQNEKEAKTVSLALQTAMMCNDSFIENPDDELASWRFVGSPTENALLSAAIQSGLRREKLLELEPRFGEMPFDSEKKYMLTLHKRSGNEYILYEKGAPEKLLEKSKKFYHLGAIHPLTPKEKEKLIAAYENLTRQGLRVIALANREINIKKFSRIISEENINWEEVDKDLIFLGFIALKDPLRKEAKETINLCVQAGIRPILITGDHKLTAKAIGEEVGLKTKAGNIIVGEELNKVNDKDLKKLVKKIDIYARVSPHHKLRIVKALQDRGEVVAMTGDGINDSPALKAADIGISLGTATDIAKETSDIVLLDNNFKTIVAAIKQGRIIFKNIRKVITYLISDSFSEMTLIIGSLLLNTPLAILPVQILWINIINDGLPHFSLAFEGDHGRVMSEKPIKKNEPLLNREMKVIIFGVGIIRDVLIFLGFYLLWLKWREAPELVSYLITLVFVTLGLKSLMSIFSLRSFKIPIWRLNPFNNLYVIGAVAVSFILLIFGVYWPPLQKLLSTTGLDLKAWGIAFSIGILNIVFLEIVKMKFKFKDKRVLS